MRPIRLVYTPAAASTTGFMTGATGVGPFTPTATTSGDSLAHLVTLTSAANLSAITITVTGEDPDGNPQTEDITGPNANTVTGTKYFSSISSVSASATLGVNTMDIGWNAVAVSKAIPLSYINETFSVGMGITVTGTVNYTIQHTFTDVFNNVTTSQNWFNHSTLTSKTASADGNYAFNIFATRLEINSVTAGATVTWEILQGTVSS